MQITLKDQLQECHKNNELLQETVEHLQGDKVSFHTYLFLTDN